VSAFAGGTEIAEATGTERTETTETATTEATDQRRETKKRRRTELLALSEPTPPTAASAVSDALMWRGARTGVRADVKFQIAIADLIAVRADMSV
jgi:hypothetical protein